MIPCSEAVARQFQTFYLRAKETIATNLYGTMR